MRAKCNVECNDVRKLVRFHHFQEATQLQLSKKSSQMIFVSTEIILKYFYIYLTSNIFIMSHHHHIRSKMLKKHLGPGLLNFLHPLLISYCDKLECLSVLFTSILVYIWR